MAFLNGFTLLLLYQLIGELLVFVTALSVPGPVVGMALLFISLLIRKGLQTTLDNASSALLGHLSLLFVPAGVGVMAHFDRIAGDWLAISVALLLSTLITLAVTALSMLLFMRLMGKGAGRE